MKSHIDIQRVEMAAASRRDLAPHSQTRPTACEVEFVLIDEESGAIARVTILTQLESPPPTAAADMGQYLIGYLRGLLTAHYTENSRSSSAMTRGLERASQTP